jgi:serine/threonine protein kinase
MIKDKDDTVRMGSPGYSPPEQYRGLSTPQSDIYALGVTLHQLLTGHDPLTTPFTLPEACQVNACIHKTWGKIVCKATQLRVEDRYASAVELKQEIDAIEKELLSRAGPGASQAKTSSSFAQRGTPSYLKYAMIVIIALLAAGALLFTWFYLTHARTEYIKLTGCLDTMKSISTAMEAYGTEHNKCPGSMCDLVPAYLPALPVCPKARKATYQIERVEVQTMKDSLIIRTTCRILCSGGYHTNLPEVKGSPFKIITIETKIEGSAGKGQGDGNRKKRAIPQDTK